MDLWTIAYIGLLIVTISAALYCRDKDYIWLCFIMIAHQAASLLIGEAAGATQPVLDFLTDVIVCAFLIHFFIELLVVRVLLVLFAIISVFAYLPRAFDLYTHAFYLEVMGSISFLMLIVILGGISSGSRNRKRRHNADILNKPSGPAPVCNVGPSRNARSILAAHGIKEQNGEEVPSKSNIVHKRKV